MAENPEKMERFLQNNPVIVVLGPNDDIFVIDRHHLSLALLKAGHETVPIRIQHDFSDCSPEEFWQKMQDRHLLHLFDEFGTPRPLTELPERLTDMKDDIYRSLAWFVRTSGGYNKVKTPYAEFQWADYFRSRLKEQFVAESFEEACDAAVALAKTPAVKDLPGYKGQKETSPASPSRKALTQQ